MKFKTLLQIIALSAFASLLIFGCDSKDSVPQDGSGKAKFSTFEDSLSYALGLQLGGYARRDSLKLNFAYYEKGYKDAMDSSNIALPDSAIQIVMAKLQEQAQIRQMQNEEKAMKEREAKSKEIAATANKFFEDFKVKPGVKTTKSGLMYQVIKAGSGATPNVDDVLTLKFVASFTNGEVFDSMAKNNPVQFPVRGLFPGWEEAARLMKVGGKYKFVFPANLAFGDKGSGPIPPNAPIIFELELIDSKKIEMPAGMQMQPPPQQGQPR